MPATMQTRRPGLDRVLALPRSRLPSLLRMLTRWRRITRERRMLTALDDRMLRDIGLAREDARREAARPFWDVPPR